MSQNPATNPMKEEFEDDEYSAENEPQQKRVFDNNQDKEYALEEDDDNKKKKGIGEDTGDDYTGDGYSFEEGASSVAAKRGDNKNLTDKNFAKKK